MSLSSGASSEAAAGAACPSPASCASAAAQGGIRDTIAAAIDALGLHHGPVHAECRINDRGVWILEVAARGYRQQRERRQSQARVGELRVEAAAEEGERVVMISHATISGDPVFHRADVRNVAVTVQDSGKAPDGRCRSSSRRS